MDSLNQFDAIAERAEWLEQHGVTEEDVKMNVNGGEYVETEEGGREFLPASLQWQ